MNCFTSTSQRFREGRPEIDDYNLIPDLLDALNPDVADCALVLTRAESWCPPGWTAEMGGYGSVSLKRPGGAWTSIRRTNGAWRGSDGHVCATFPEALERLLEAEQ